MTKQEALTEAKALLTRMSNKRLPIEERKLLYARLKELVRKYDLKYNPYPQICPNCGARIYATITPIKCPVCGKPWKEKNPKEKHWGRHTFVQTSQSELAPGRIRKYGYCSICHCDMAITTGGIVQHTGSHKWYRLYGGKNPESLYESFHGSQPLRVRKIRYEPPKGKLIKIGRLMRVEYEPEFPSKRVRTRFYHEMGDTGSEVLRSNAILATDEKGKNLYILRDKNTKRRPFFSPRGIIG